MSFVARVALDASDPLSWWSSKTRPILHAVLLLCLCGVLVFWRLGDRDLWSSHEARAAMDARSILEEGLWLPHLDDGRAEVQKPPLYYWLVASLSWARGSEVDALAVRLPAALSALACVLLLGRIVGRTRPLAGLMAGVVLITGIHFPWLARIGRIDVPLSLTTTIAAGAFFLACQRRSFLLLLLAYLAASVGILLKGPLGLVLPGAILAAHRLLEGEWPAFWELPAWRKLLASCGVWWGLGLVLSLTVPVFLWADHASGGTFLHEFLWLHNVERGLGGEHMRSHRWYLYAPYFLLYFLPWTPLFLLALFDRRWRDDPLARFGLAWVIGVICLLSCAHFKRADYLAPAYPGAALFLGCALARWLEGPWRPVLVRHGVAVVVVAAVIGWVVEVGWRLPAEEEWRDYTRFAREVRKVAPAPTPVTFFQTEAHALAFHLGRPQRTIVEWEELRAALRSPGPHYLILAPRSLTDWRTKLPEVTLHRLHRTTDRVGKHERDLLLVQAVPEESTGP